MRTRKRGPLPTGEGALVGVRLQSRELKALDGWIRRNRTRQTRPAAIRELVSTGLVISEITRGLARNRSPHAIELAA